jgi:chemotaxis protein methyltransferase WspC
MTALSAIEMLLAERIGLDVASTGPALIHRAVHERMQCRQVTDADQYGRVVESDEAELRALIDLVVVTESWFFRDLRPFLRLQAFVRDEWRPSGPARFRVLSIPCAHGEEAYSLAIALLDAGLTPEQIVIDAVDVSERVLNQARTGNFRSTAMRKELIGNPAHFLRETEDGFDIRPEIREMVRFRQGNLLDAALQPGESEYDAVFCRNVLIYLTPAAKATAILRLKSLLRPGGLLFVGHAEALTALRDHFVADSDVASFAYRRPLLTSTEKPLAGNQLQDLRSGERTRSIRRPSPAALQRKLEQPPSSRNTGPQEPRIALAQLTQASKLAQASQMADRKEYVQAARLCQQLLTEHGPDPRVYLLLGMIDLERGRTAEAEAYLHKVAYLDNTNVEALLALASLARQRGDMAAADRHSRRANRVEKQKKEQDS